jgi:hypothetical protein
MCFAQPEAMIQRNRIGQDVRAGDVFGRAKKVVFRETVPKKTAIQRSRISDLLEANLVLYRIAVDGDGELGQGAGSGGADVILAIATSS